MSISLRTELNQQKMLKAMKMLHARMEKYCLLHQSFLLIQLASQKQKKDQQKIHEGRKKEREYRIRSM